MEQNAHNTLPGYNDWQTEQAARHSAIDAAIAKHGLSVRAEFVPFSQSRNKGENVPSLNWSVTLVKSCQTLASLNDSRPILTTDYCAGCGHCPSYRQSWGQPTPADTERFVAVCKECEHGLKLKPRVGFGFVSTGKPILPSTADVLYSLIMNFDVLDASSFEDWAANFGYDTDSRAAEATYRACLDVALKLRNGLGETTLAELREAFQDY